MHDPSTFINDKPTVVEQNAHFGCFLNIPRIAGLFTLHVYMLLLHEFAFTLNRNMRHERAMYWMVKCL